MHQFSRNMAEVNVHCVEKLQVLRGMVDLLPSETILWQHIEESANRHFKKAGVSEIRTPLLEATELFSRGIGEATDVVGKEMYSFLDRGNRNCTLRPEGTASVVRSVIQNGLTSQGPQKLWYSGPMFRYERPQAGRQRQFHQIGLEFIGFGSPRSEVEAISIAWDLLKELGVTGLNLEINSLGNDEDRKTYRKNLVAWLEENFKSLDSDSQTRLKKNPLRILDSKNPSTKALLTNAPNLKDFLSKESKERFQKVEDELTKLSIPFEVNPMLVRGLDYYSHTAFEITSSDLGAQSTVCGGGRYDGLVEQLGGPSTPAIGWAIGMERLILLLSRNEPETYYSPTYYLVNRGEQAESFALKVARDLRYHNQNVELDLSSAAFSKQLKRADRSGAKWAVLIGDTEAKEHEVILKDLRSKKEERSKEERLKLKDLLKRFS